MTRVAEWNVREPRFVLKVLHGLHPDVAQDLRDRLLRFEYTSQLRKTDVASMELDNTDGSLLSKESIALGIELEIQWGYVDALTAPRKLTIKKVQGLSGRTRRGGGHSPVRESLGGSGKVRLELWSRIQKFHQLQADDEPGPNSPRIFVNMKISDIVRSIAGAAGFMGPTVLVEDLPNDPVRDEIVIPVSMTDAQWLSSQADDAGYDFSVDEDGFHWHSRTFDRTPEVELTFFDGTEDVRGYNMEGDLTFGAPRRTSARGFDPLRNRRVSFTAAALDEGALNDAESPSSDENEETGAHIRSLRGFGSGVVVPARSRMDVFPVSRASERAQNAAMRKLRDQAEKWKISLDLVGNPAVRAKRWIKLGNFGELIDGVWYIRKASHLYRAGNVYTTKIDEATRTKPGERGRRDRALFRSDALPDGDAEPAEGAAGSGALIRFRRPRR